MTIQQFAKINELDRLASEIAWYNLVEDYAFAVNQAMASRDNATTQEDYEYFDAEATIALYYASIYESYYNLCCLQ